MLELDDKDLKAIANGRYNRSRYGRLNYIICALTVLAVIASCILIENACYIYVIGGVCIAILIMLMVFNSCKIKVIRKGVKEAYLEENTKV